MDYRKKESVNVLTKVFREYSGLVVLGFAGMTSKQSLSLHRSLWDVDGNFIVVKNNLAKIALDSLSIQVDSSVWVESNCVAYGSDVAKLLKLLYLYIEENSNFMVKEVFLDQEKIDFEFCDQIMKYGNIDMIKYTVADLVANYVPKQLLRVINYNGINMSRVIDYISKDK